MTFYRKYRPKIIDELDLASVRERLSTIVKTKKFSHAYLFAGPRGTGKTSAARIMAREAGAQAEDVIELDAASHRGIDDIRELRERVGIAPMVGNIKAYIIDEVHMLTAEAFNALLKTLEEPPSHIIFFLCTTHIEKVPDTIVSRCVHISFPRSTAQEIMRALNRTVAGEKLSVGEGVLPAIASWADGSFREAQTILEEAASNKHRETIAPDDVERVVGGSFSNDVPRYVTSVIQGDAQTAVSVVEDVVQRGGDVMVFTRMILSELRDRLVEDRTDRVLRVTKNVEECTRTLKYSLLPQLPLEIAAMELEVRDKGPSYAASPTKTLATLGKASEGKQGPRDEGKTHSEHSENSTSPPPAGRAGAGRSDDQNISIPESRSGQIKTRPTSPKLRLSDHSDTPVSPSIPSFQNTSTSISIADLKEKWPQLLEQVRKKNHGIVTLLAHCRPLSVEGGMVLVEAKYKFHKDQLMQERFRSLVEEEMRGVVGENVGVRFILGQKTERVLQSLASDDTIRAVADEELVDTVEEVFAA